MESLIALLSHPYLILNHVAKSVYQAEGQAVYQRLRSRVKGRHRFTLDDYKAIRKSALAFSRRLDSLAGKLEAAAGESSKDWRKHIQHDWLNHKEVVAKVGEGFKLDYLASYDGLRARRELPDGYLEALAAEYRRFAEWVRAQLDLAKEEKKEYVFSQGRGAGSHV